MKTILTIAGVMALGVAGYAISAADEKPADGSSTARPACCAKKNAAKAADKSGGEMAYCQKSTAAAATAASRTPQGQEVTLTGRVLCEHCDLHMGAACAPALKAEGRDGYLKICPTSKDIQALKEAGDVEVRGYVRSGSDGRDEIEVVSFNKRPSKT